MMSTCLQFQGGSVWEVGKADRRCDVKLLLVMDDLASRRLQLFICEFADMFEDCRQGLHGREFDAMALACRALKDLLASAMVIIDPEQQHKLINKHQYLLE